MSSKRTYLDPIHQEIVLDQSIPEEKLIVDLIDSPEFQRLRRIRQLEVASFTFHGAEGSRFTHSLGVMHIASQLMVHLSEQNPIVKDLAALVLATALLHDVGHGPYSHVSEKIFGYDHEDWSCKIVTGDTTVRQMLDDYDPQLSRHVSQVLKKEFSPHFVSQIVSSQLDCDRFDYLLRDSYMTGTSYGVFALKRVISSMELDERSDRIIINADKGLIAVEDYLFSRYSMYAQVYYHKKNLAARALLKMLVKRARELGTQVGFVDEPTFKLIQGKPMEVNEYLQLDDVQLTYHIKRWATSGDPVLADLSSRFLHRRIFKAVRLPAQGIPAIDEIVNAAKRALKKVGLDPEYYVSVESLGLRPYDYYRPDATHPQTSIMVRTESGAVQELSSLSAPVAAMVKGNFDTCWLIFPDEAALEISKIRALASYV